MDNNSMFPKRTNIKNGKTTVVSVSIDTHTHFPPLLEHPPLFRSIILTSSSTREWLVSAERETSTGFSRFKVPARAQNSFDAWNHWNVNARPIILIIVLRRNYRVVMGNVCRFRFRTLTWNTLY